MHVLFSNETGNVPQIVYYQSGVGSESDFLGSINTTTKEVVRKFLANLQLSRECYVSTLHQRGSDDVLVSPGVY